MIYFLVYLFLEVVVSVNIASSIGGFATFLEIIFSAFLGLYILSNFKTTFVKNLRSVSYSQIDFMEFERLNLFTIFGAILLIVPGFMTDILGVLLQFSVITSMVANRYNKKTNSQEFNNDFTKENDDVIDVEIIEHNTTK